MKVGPSGGEEEGQSGPGDSGAEPGWVGGCGCVGVRAVVSVCAQ